MFQCEVVGQRGLVTHGAALAALVVLIHLQVHGRHHITFNLSIINKWRLCENSGMAKSEHHHRVQLDFVMVLIPYCSNCHKHYSLTGPTVNLFNM